MYQLRVGAEAGHERRLILRRAPHEAVTQPSPRGNGIPRGKQFVGRSARSEELVSADAVVVDGGEKVPLRWGM